jgi:hypothetical protein
MRGYGLWQRCPQVSRARLLLHSSLPAAELQPGTIDPDQVSEDSVLEYSVVFTSQTLNHGDKHQACPESANLRQPNCKPQRVSKTPMWYLQWFDMINTNHVKSISSRSWPWPRGHGVQVWSWVKQGDQTALRNFSIFNKWYDHNSHNWLLLSAIVMSPLLSSFKRVYRKEFLFFFILPVCIFISIHSLHRGEFIVIILNRLTLYIWLGHWHHLPPQLLPCPT